jgi:hypothetical protein
MDLHAEIPYSLALLDQYVGKAASEWQANKNENLPFSRASILLIQHQLGTHFSLVNAFIQLGVSPKRIFSIDIPYSSSEITQSHLKLYLKIPPNNIYKHDYTLEQPYSQYQSQRVARILPEILVTLDDEGPLIVIDDGAYFLEGLSLLKETDYIKYVRQGRLIIVEQTTRGLIKIRENVKLQQLLSILPLIDVAESQVKKELEPKYIAQYSLQKLDHVLAKHLQRSDNGSILVTGFGAIGKAVAFEVKQVYPKALIYILDPSVDRQHEACEKGFKLWHHDLPAQPFSIVIGCSGVTSITPADILFLNNDAILVSMSSGTHELNVDGFLDQASSGKLKLISELVTKSTDIHNDLKFKFEAADQQIYFTIINGGMPISFDGNLTCVPGPKIQQTLTMLVAGAVQGSYLLNSNSAASGIVSLDKSFQEWLTTEFREIERSWSEICD